MKHYFDIAEKGCARAEVAWEYSSGGAVNAVAGTM